MAQMIEKLKQDAENMSGLLVALENILLVLGRKALSAENRTRFNEMIEEVYDVRNAKPYSYDPNK